MVDVFDWICCAEGTSSKLPDQPICINNGQADGTICDEETPFQASLPPYRQSTTDMTAALVSKYDRVSTTPDVNDRRGRSKNIDKGRIRIYWEESL